MIHLRRAFGLLAASALFTAQLAIPGLAIARSYANAHSGELVYEPVSPTGARFELVLPHNGNGDDVRAHRLRSYRR